MFPRQRAGGEQGACLRAHEWLGWAHRAGNAEDKFWQCFYTIKIILALGIALIQLLMKSEGGFGGSWCERFVQTQKAKEVGVKTSAQGGAGFGLFKIRGFMQEVFIDIVT